MLSLASFTAPALVFTWQPRAPLHHVVRARTIALEEKVGPACVRVDEESVKQLRETFRSRWAARSLSHVAPAT